MNSAPTNTLPAPASNIGTPTGLVVCAFIITPPCSEFACPADNRIGLRLASVLLAEAAAADGHCAVGGITTCGELNSGVVLADYEQPEMAAQAWLAALRRCALSGDVHLAWRDAAGVWHPVAPRKLDFQFEAVTTAEFMEREKTILQLLIRQAELTRLQLILSLPLLRNQS